MSEAPIRQNAISHLFSVLALTMLAFLSTFGGYLVIPTLIALSLNFSGDVLSRRFKIESEDDSIDRDEAQNIGLFFVIAIFAIMVANIFVPELRFPAQNAVAIHTFYGTFSLDIGATSSSILNFASLDIATQNRLFAAFIFVAFLIPVSEEQFFRAFFGNLFISKAGLALGLLVNGLLFAGFHIAVDGLNYYTLTIIAVSGMTLTWVDFMTKSVVTSILAHITNNALSFLVAGNLIRILLPWLPPLPVQTIMPVINFGIPLALVLYVNRRKISEYIPRIDLVRLSI